MRSSLRSSERGEMLVLLDQQLKKYIDITTSGVTSFQNRSFGKTNVIKLLLIIGSMTEVQDYHIHPFHATLFSLN